MREPADLTSAECVGFARAFEENGYFEKAASYWRDAAELAWIASLQQQFEANARACDRKALGSVGMLA